MREHPMGWILMVLILGLGAGGPLPGGRAADAGFIIQGQIQDSRTGALLPAAEILDPEGRIIVADDQGRFEYRAPSEELVVLQIQTARYRRLKRGFRGPAGQVLEVQIKLDRLPTFDEEMLVVGQSIPAIEPVQRLQPEVVAEIPGAGEDVLQTVKVMPGVVGGDDFSGRLYVRGGRPDQNGIYLDGIPIYDPYRLFGLTSLFNPETLESILLYPGGFDVRYGDRLSAVVAVENRVGTLEQGLAGSANLSLTNTNLVAEGGLGLGVPSSWLLTFRRTYYDLMLRYLGEEGTSYPSFTDMQARFLLEPSPDHRWTVTLLGSLEGTDLDIEEESDFGDQDDEFSADDDQKDYVAGLQGRHLLDPRLKLQYVLSWTQSSQISEISFTQGETGYESRLDQDLVNQEISFRPHLESYLGRHTMLTGFEFSKNEGEVHFNIDTEDPRWQIPEELLNFGITQDYGKYGAYLQDTWQVTPDWEVKAGFRWDHSTLSDMSATSPRASARWRPRKGWELGAAWGYYYQFPSYESLQGDGYFLDLRGIENLRLSPERAIHYIASCAYRSTRGWKIGLDLYYKDLEDLLQSGREEEILLVLDDEGQTSEYTREISNFVPENTREGYARGVDVTLTLLENADRPYHAMLNYSFSQAESRDEDGWLWGPRDRRHSLTFLGGMRLGQHWEIGWKWRFGTGFPYTPLDNIIRVVDDVDGDGQYEPDDGESWTYQRDEPQEAWRSRRYPAYHRLDLRGEYTQRFSRVDASFYVDLINVYARENVFGYSYNEDFTERVEETGMPFLPSLGIKARF